MRDRLIELINRAKQLYKEDMAFDTIDGAKMPTETDYIADYLLANDVVCPPCKVGDKIYDISEFLDGTNSPEMYEFKAENITITKLNGEIIFEIDSLFMRHSDFGKALFLSKEEAEKALGGVQE